MREKITLQSDWSAGQMVLTKTAQPDTHGGGIRKQPAALQQRLGDGQNALAAKLGAGGHAQLLDLFGE